MIKDPETESAIAKLIPEGNRFPYVSETDL
jgi:hypothetical protein